MRNKNRNCDQELFRGSVCCQELSEMRIYRPHEPFVRGCVRICAVRPCRVSCVVRPCRTRVYVCTRVFGIWNVFGSCSAVRELFRVVGNSISKQTFFLKTTFARVFGFYAAKSCRISHVRARAGARARVRTVMHLSCRCRVWGQHVVVRRCLLSTFFASRSRGNHG